MAEFTPGPWGVFEPEDGTDLEIRPQEDCVEGLWSWECIASNPSSDANARLIAAAPDLLAVAEAIQRWLESDQVVFNLITDIEPALVAAITKAKGVAP